MAKNRKSIAQTLVSAPIKLYRLLLSPLLGHNCRFSPSCSEYALTAIEQYGVIKGSSLAVKRLSKCHPWGSSGHDPVPER
jgi:putative membrane protein insertion efficiency factor